MRHRLFTVLFLSTLFLSSCSTYRHSVNVADFGTDAYTDDVYATLIVDKDNKIEGKSKATFIFNFIQIGGGKDYAEIQTANAAAGMLGMFGARGEKFKSLALGAATKNTDYDVIVSPRYYSHLTTHLFGLIKTYEVKVVGYGAKIDALDAVMPVRGYYGYPQSPISTDVIIEEKTSQAPASVQTSVPVASNAAERAVVQEPAPDAASYQNTAPRSSANTSEDEFIEDINNKILSMGQRLKSEGASQDLLGEIQALRARWKNSGIKNRQDITSSLTTLELQCKSKIKNQK